MSDSLSPVIDTSFRSKGLLSYLVQYLHLRLFVLIRRN